MANAGRNEKPIERILRLSPPPVARAVADAGTDGLEEIRVRAGRPVQLVYGGGEKLLGICADAELCEGLLESLSEHSAFALEEELSRGFFTVGACRVGVCGRAFVKDGRLVRFREISSFNIRIASEQRGAADGVTQMLFGDGGVISSALVVSPPGAGKTTLLRDIARRLSDGDGARRGLKVAVADERGELAGSYMGGLTLDVGARTDVMDGCPKAEAMLLMIRSMSPEAIVTDEIGSAEDVAAVKLAMSSGVAVMASVHAGSVEEAMGKPGMGELAALFGRTVFIERSGAMRRFLVEKCAR